MYLFLYIPMISSFFKDNRVFFSLVSYMAGWVMRWIPNVSKSDKSMISNFRPVSCRLCRLQIWVTRQRINFKLKITEIADLKSLSNHICNPQNSKLHKLNLKSQTLSWFQIINLQDLQLWTVLRVIRICFRLAFLRRVGEQISIRTSPESY